MKSAGNYKLVSLDRGDFPLFNGVIILINALKINYEMGVLKVRFELC